MDAPRPQSELKTGMIWHAQIVDEKYNSKPPPPTCTPIRPLRADGTRSLPTADPKHCLPDGALKPRRPIPHIRLDDFLARLEEKAPGNFILAGELNGWGALRDLEVVSITAKVPTGIMGGMTVKRLWSTGQPALKKLPEKLPKSVRVTLRQPNWSAKGWSETASGMVFWAALQRAQGPRLTFGDNIVKSLEEDVDDGASTAATPSSPMSWNRMRHHVMDGIPNHANLLHSMPQATTAHMVAHKYTIEYESAKDMITWHTLVLIEWDHGLYCSVFELAWWNGLSGYGGKSNFVRDRDANPVLYKVMPPEMKSPWNSSLAEVRIIDVPCKNVDEFEAFLHEYSEKGDLPMEKQRFKLPEVAASAPVRLMNRSQADLFRYVLNYMKRETRYSEQARNCQTFAADFFGFLAGKAEGIPVSNKNGPRNDLMYFQPFHQVCRAFYKPRPHLFPYDP